MNYLGVHQTPDLLEEVWRELGRERERERLAREARQVDRHPRVATLSAYLRRVLRPERRRQPIRSASPMRIPSGPRT